MAKNVFLYPRLSPYSVDKVEGRIDHTIEYHVSYRKEPIKRLVSFSQLSRQSKRYVVVGEDIDWDIEQEDFSYTYPVKFLEGLEIFGAFVPKGVRLQLLIKWFSRDTGVRGYSSDIHIVDQFNYTEQFDLTVRFPANEFFGSIEVQPILVLADNLEGEALTVAEQKGFAVHKGALLGFVDEPIELSLDGVAGDFPLITQPMENQVVPWLFHSLEIDPTIQAFDVENVALILNETHPTFNLFTEPLQRNNILREALSSWHFELYQWVRSRIILESDDQFYEMIHNGPQEGLQSDMFNDGSTMHYLVQFLHDGIDLSILRDDHKLKRAIHQKFWSL